MNVPGSTGPAGLPPVNQALQPEWVRRGSASTQRAYEAALSFEQTLVEQLARSLTATSGLDGESSPEGESGSEDASSNELSSMLPQALSAGVMNAGGLGLAAQLTRGLQGTVAAPPAQAPGTGQAGASTAPAVAPSTAAAVGAAGGTDATSTGGAGS